MWNLRGSVAATVVVLSLSGCGGDPAPSSTAPATPVAAGATRAAGPATLDNPLGSGAIDTGVEEQYAALALRDAVLAAVRDAGGARGVVTGAPNDVTLEVVPGEQAWVTGARRWTWHEDGTDREQVQLASGRVCLNRATGEALQALGSSTFGHVVPSSRPYSCTERGSSVGGFVVFGMAALDPLGRLGTLMGETAFEDLGVESDPSGVSVRHVRVTGPGEALVTSTTPATTTPYDLWLDADLRPLRIDFANRDDATQTLTATLSYDDPPVIELPPGAGPLVFEPGDGHVGSYLGPRGPAPTAAPTPR